VIERTAGAPRLIEWTGERCVPWTPEVAVAYEHYHRYLWAAELVRGRTVLDLASGEGFGAAILAATAESVTGIDADPRTVEHSRLNYMAPNLGFTVGSALELEGFGDGSFGAVVAFELIEHLADHERFLAELDRVLAPDGVAIVSTPDAPVYSEGKDSEPNPFHERELTEAEFRDVLGARFEHVALWGQRAADGSRIAAIDDAGTSAPQAFVLERDGEDWRPGGEWRPVYLIAVVSHAGGFEAPAESTMVDPGLGLVVAKERELVENRHQRALAQEEARMLREDAEFLRSLRDGDNRARFRWALASSPVGDLFRRVRGPRRPSAPGG
jgi:SAM-dependent methyltransferase